MSLCTLTCRNCGGFCDLPDGQTHAPCRFCGVELFRPVATGEAFDKLQRATRLRLNGERSEALRCYEHVLFECEDEPEALWGKLLCQYGVEFVTDPKTNVRHATVHVPHSRPMQLHADFLRACELAPEALRAQYEAEAAYVDEAMAEINRHRDSSPPFDIFLCHKTTPLTGEGYTEDYHRGVQLYMALKEAGYRVFFAPFAGLQPGASYEAGIYYALSTAKVMLLISSDTAFLNSPWVKSEWSRYLEMLDDGADKHLLPLMYGGLTNARMPREIRLRGLLSIRMEDFGTDGKLLETVGGYVGKGKTEPVPPEPVIQEEPPKPEPTPVKPVQEPVKPVPVAKPKPKAAPRGPEPTPVMEPTPATPKVEYAPESDFVTKSAMGGVIITKYTGTGGEVLIPPTIGRWRVVEIGENAFSHYRRLTSVVIPEGVTSIGDEAFEGCSSLTSVSIPEGVTSIGAFAFNGCSSLTSVSIPEDVTTIGSSAFAGCSSLTSVSIPEGVTTIEDGVFHGCSSLTSVSIPEGVTTIEDRMFEGCSSLTSVSIPEGVTSIGNSAFSGCSSLTSVVIPEDVTTIEDWVFSNCSSLTSMVIPEGVTSIGYAVFYGCSSLTSVVIPEGVTSIAHNAFFSCPNLKLTVHANSPAHQYAKEHNIPCDVVGLAPQKTAAIPSGTTQLLLKRSRKYEGSLRTIAVRIDGDKVYLLKNGESMTLQLAPGRHAIDVKYHKILFFDGPKWDSLQCAQDVHPQTMQAGQRYTVDVADYLRRIRDC